jgi:4-hydroxy-3-methylbut-2-en-1-yl diphosphate reductase
MHIIRAKHLGMCFGVRDAIALAFEQAETRPLTILGDLVHNPSVSADIRARGIATVRELAQVTTQTVMVTAHGASERALARTRALGLEVVEATCPLVHVAHKAVRTLVGQGYYPVIVGQRDHVEVRGLTEDLLEFDVVMDERDVMALTPRARIGVAAQTTQPIEKVRRLVQLIQRRFPASEVRFVDTVCQPTKQRQNAALALSRESDVVVVVGGANSNNTRELVNTCRTHGARVYHVQSELDLRPEWFADANTVGLTAGTSTPDAVIDRVENRLREWAGGITDMNVSLAQSTR